MARTAFAQNGLVRLGYEVQGETGPVVMILHGLLGDRASLRPLIDALADQATVITMDLRGHGGSSAIHGVDMQLSALVDDAFAVLDAAEITAPVVVVGVELGGVIATAMQESKPERLTGTVLVNYPSAEMRDSATLNDIATRAYREQSEQALNRWLDLSWGEGWQGSVPKPRIAAARRSVQAIHPILTAMEAADLPDAVSLHLPGGTPFASDEAIHQVMQELGPHLIGG
jgi:3-oxoadipate enol-lactonase